MRERKDRGKNCLWYEEPASDTYDGWEREALPIGNGELGCKIFGGVETEHIQFNEKSLWSGTTVGKKDLTGKINTNGNGQSDFGKSVKKIQDLLAKGDKTAATTAMQQLQGDEIGLGAYQNFGDLYIEFTGMDGRQPENYVRSLDLLTAEAKVEYTIGQDHYTREYFVSYPDQVAVIRLCGDMKRVIVRVEGAQPGSRTEWKDSQICLSKMKDHDSLNELQYEARFLIQTDGQILGTEKTVEFTNAKEIILLFCAGTNYLMKYPDYRCEDDFSVIINARLQAASKLGYNTLKKRHAEDYRILFDRVDLSIGQEENTVPTNLLLENYQKGNRSRLLEYLMFQYGRYLLIASSREGGLPANLQGVWNAQNQPAWQSDYHLNINLQMNYWLSMNTNLSEMAKPLVDYVNNCLVVPGRMTAFYCVGIGEGDVNKPTGWMAHTQNNIFGHTGPGSNWRWGWAPTTGAFILENTYEYYRFTKDVDYLEKEIYPAMEEAALMWDQLLIEDKDSNRLVVSPCFSPEHGPVSIGNTFDQEMIWQLFYNVIEAADELKAAGKENSVNEKLLNRLREKIIRLQPIIVGKWGQVKEWYEEDSWKDRGFADQEVVKNHRHFSHMMGLYPGNHITPDNKEWMEAAKVSMEDRKDYGEDFTPGWSKALKMGAWARLLDSDKCDFYIRKVIEENTYSNLWETHPPFQIDGNFGTSAGMAEMLLQSQTDLIHLLPALPSSWKERGAFRGLKARGNITVACTWEKGQVSKAEFISPISQVIKIKMNNEIKEIALTEGKIEYLS